MLSDFTQWLISVTLLYSVSKTIGGNYHIKNPKWYFYYIAVVAACVYFLFFWVNPKAKNCSFELGGCEDALILLDMTAFFLIFGIPMALGQQYLVNLYIQKTINTAQPNKNKVTTGGYRKL